MKLLALALCTACYSPTYRDCEVTCASSQVCPGDYVCKAGYCVSELSSSCIDAPPGITWTEPTALKFVAGTTLGLDDDPTLTNNLLRLYVHRTVGGTGDIYAAARNDVSAAFDSPSAVTELSSTSDDTTPELSGDGLTMHFASNRPGGVGGYDIWVATRSSVMSPFGTPTWINEVSNAADDMSPTVSADGLTMVFASTRNPMTAGDVNLFITTRMSPTGLWTSPQAMTGLNTPSIEESPFLAPNKLTIFFTSTRMGDRDLFQAERATVTEAFGPPTRITDLSTTPGHDLDPWLSGDGTRMVFARTIGGMLTLMESTR